MTRSTRSVREDIVRALTGHQGSVTAIADKVELPVRVVREELEKMRLEGVARARQHRSGITLYTVPSANDRRWDALRGPALQPTR